MIHMISYERAASHSSNHRNGREQNDVENLLLLTWPSVVVRLLDTWRWIYYMTILNPVHVQACIVFHCRGPTSVSLHLWNISYITSNVSRHALQSHLTSPHILSFICIICIQHASLFTVNGRLVDAAFLRALNSPEIYLQRSASLGLACLYTVS